MVGGRCTTEKARRKAVTWRCWAVSAMPTMPEAGQSSPRLPGLARAYGVTVGPGSAMW